MAGMETIFELADIAITAEAFVIVTASCKVFGFTGDLGAGKTTFIKAVCQVLGVKEPVTSPTYAIIQEYHSEKNSSIYHMDLYRIKNTDEAIEAGVEDCLRSGNLCFVEWPEKAIVLLPPQTVYCTLQAVSDHTRKLIVQLPQ
jgi:tRNA threonylcarbamoyladenosine biosynthesis protein TsaE